MNLKQYISGTRMAVAAAIASIAMPAALAQVDTPTDIQLPRPRVVAIAPADSILMGTLSTIDVMVDSPEAEQGYFAVINNTPQIEFRQNMQPPVLDKSAGNNVYRATFTIQPFDPGAWRIAPIALITPNDTIVCDSLTVLVSAIDVSSLRDGLVNPDIDELQSFEIHWYDALPKSVVDNWIIILSAIVVIIGCVCAYLIHRRRKLAALMPAKPSEPPYDEAMRMLDQLRQQHLWEKGQEKLYYTDLSYIFRNYLYRRFGINALEMTSSQIIDAMVANTETASHIDTIRPMLNLADMVKFAKSTPQSHENNRAFDATVNFVEETKEIPQSVADDDDDDEYEEITDKTVTD